MEHADSYIVNIDLDKWPIILAYRKMLGYLAVLVLVVHGTHQVQHHSVYW